MRPPLFPCVNQNFGAGGGALLRIFCAPVSVGAVAAGIGLHLLLRHHCLEDLPVSVGTLGNGH